MDGNYISPHSLQHHFLPLTFRLLSTLPVGRTDINARTTKNPVQCNNLPVPTAKPSSPTPSAPNTTPHVPPTPSPVLTSPSAAPPVSPPTPFTSPPSPTP